MKNRVLAFTPTYGDRIDFGQTVFGMRATADHWFDWLVVGGALSERYQKLLEEQFYHPQRMGIQFVSIYKENIGQHHAFQIALELAREHEYDWLVRIDDDIKPKSKRWLKHMLQRLHDLKRLAGDDKYRIVASPKIVGLKYQIETIGKMGLEGLTFPVDVMPGLGGALRLHHVPFLAGYKPPLLGATGRGDPEALVDYVSDSGGTMVRFPDIRVVHDTAALEAKDDEAARRARRMSWVWPFLGEPTPIQIGMRGENGRADESRTDA